MERNEPTFVPEWLKSSGTLSTPSHQFQSSSLHSDEQGVPKATRNKSLKIISDNDRTTSSYFRRTSSSNGSSHLRSCSSFGRYSDKEKSENRHHDYSDSFLGNILPSRIEKEGLRRPHSSVSAKGGESSCPRKVVTNLTSANKSNHSNGGGVKIAFERDFPSLGADEKQVDSGLSSAIQSLPVGNVAVTGGDGWTSALAEVPVIAGGNTTASVSVTTTGRNMAETLAQGPQTAPQLTVGSQRLEELAVKQSRQLIPMTPSLPKVLALDKTKAHSISSKFDTSKTSKLQVLKPSRGSPTGGGNKLPNSPLAAAAPPVTTTSAVTTLEKRPSSQAKSRNDFFNLVRRKSMTIPDTVTDPVAVGGSHADVANGRSFDAILQSEEAEARFLRSMGWEETGEEEGGLTEEEINSFYLNLQAASKGTQQKLVTHGITPLPNGNKQC